MQDRVERSPTLQPNEPAQISAEETAPRRGEHQEHGHREGADVEALEHDAQQRHPGLGLPPDGPVRGHGLGLGAGFGVGAKRGGVAGFRGPLFACVVNCVQQHLLLNDIGRGARRADQEVVRHRQRREEFRARERFGGGVREEPDSENTGCTADLRRPERVQARRRLRARHHLGVHRRGAGGARGLAGGEFHQPRRRGAGGGRTARRHERPEVCGLPQIVRGNVPQQQRVKNALTGVVSEIPGEHRIGDLHASDGVGEPGPEDHPVTLVGEIVRQRERLLREPCQPVTDFGRERGEQRKPDRHVGHHRGRERGVQPVHDPHGGLRHDHRAPHGGEHQHPFGVVLPVSAERRSEKNPGESGDTGDLGEREVGAAAGDGGHRVEQVDQVNAAAEGEQFVHRR